MGKARTGLGSGERVTHFWVSIQLRWLALPSVWGQVIPCDDILTTAGLPLLLSRYAAIEWSSEREENDVQQVARIPALEFVHPQSGETSWLLLPSVNVETFSIALAAFAQEVGVGPEKPIVLVLDGAGWHRSQQVQVPQGLHLLFLPPYSPELQPSEHLWPLTNEPLANRPFVTLDELEQVQVERCRWLQTQPALVRAHTCFHWWPTLVHST